MSDEARFRLVCGGRRRGDTLTCWDRADADCWRDWFDSRGDLSCSPHHVEELVDGDWVHARHEATT